MSSLLICLLISYLIVLSAGTPLCDPSVSDVTIDFTFIDDDTLYLATNDKLAMFNMVTKEIQWIVIYKVFLPRPTTKWNIWFKSLPIEAAYIHKWDSSSSTVIIWDDVCYYDIIRIEIYK